MCLVSAARFLISGVIFWLSKSMEWIFAILMEKPTETRTTENVPHLNSCQMTCKHRLAYEWTRVHFYLGSKSCALYIIVFAESVRVGIAPKKKAVAARIRSYAEPKKFFMLIFIESNRIKKPSWSGSFYCRITSRYSSNIAS